MTLKTVLYLKIRMRRFFQIEMGLVVLAGLKLSTALFKELKCLFFATFSAAIYL